MSYNYIHTQSKQEQVTINYIKINNVSVIPFTSATISVDTFTEDKNFVYNKFLTMDTQTYLQWMNNDQFLINWICSQLGLTPS